MNRNRSNRRIVIVLAAGAFLILIGASGRIAPVRWLYAHTLAPIGHGLGAAGSATSAAVANLGRVSHLAADNAALERENASLRQRLAADSDTRRDNDQLRRELGLTIAGGPRQIGADVVAFQPDSYRQFITIDRGSSSGLAKGQAVLSDGVMVGIINSISTTSAKVLLVTDPEFRLAVKDDLTGAQGILSGQLGSGLIMDQISQTDQIKPGDSVTSAGLGGVIPASLYVGQVQSVNTRQNAVFQSAQITTTVRPNQLKFVFVVVGS